MNSLEIMLVLLLGLAVGSFLNVVIWRLPRMLDGEINQTLTLSKPASFCPACKSTLKVWHNIPLWSYAWLRGRCGFCAAPIHWQYPAVELANALLWLLCALHWGFVPSALAWSIFMSFLLTLSVIDGQTTYLPDVLTQPLLWLGLLASTLGLTEASAQQAIWGVFAGYGSLWLVASTFQLMTGKEGMGAGDFKFLAALGAWLGPLALLPLVLIASISGALVGIWMQATHRMKHGGYLPFGPFLAVAAVFQALYGKASLFFYINWLS